MARYILAGVIISVVFSISMAAIPRAGFCLGCLWTSACYSDSICGGGCICVKRDILDVGGYCAVR